MKPSIRETKIDDRPAILSLLEAAFGGADEARLVERLWAANAIAHERLAIIDGKIVGYCAFSRVRIAPPIAGVALGLAPVAVAPAHQKTGVGSDLIRDCLATLQENKTAAIVLLGHEDYYPRFGFAPAARSNVRWDAMDAGDAFQLIDYAGVFDGTPRVISYHPEFSAL